MVAIFGSETVLQKRSMRISGHRTSIALEPIFWGLLEEMAEKKGQSLPFFIGEVYKRLSEGTNHAGALRVLVVKSLKEKA